MTTATVRPDIGEPSSASAIQPSAEPATHQSRGHQRVLVNGARVALLMLFVAGIAMLGLGIAVLAMGDPPEENGWLRSAFGVVFGYMLIATAAALGTPAAVGVWAMSGANSPGATPALSRRVQRAARGIAVLCVLVTAVVVLAFGSGVSFFDLVLVGLVSMLTLGLAGAVTFSPHRLRAALAGVVLILVTAGTLWVLAQALMAVPR